ncbi:hypothetical protein MN608_09864 [Microdochium nivale]|nr:hypothetical protein MN608_09864 [Microdochium nivale]
MRSTLSTARAAPTDDLDAITPCPPRESQEPTQLKTSDYNMLHPCADSNASDSARTSRSASPSADDEAASHFAHDDDESGRKQRRRSVKALEDGTEGDPARLWQRMLALQQAYGCYKSARMSAALSSSDASLLLPSKACLDMMNEHMCALPDDVDLTIEQHLQHES